ncbi:recombinase [Lysobacteraceae bacterium NML07-0707]|nr:recombinase [Xanthomonadaceae bacterium NML07-0707]
MLLHQPGGHLGSGNGVHDDVFAIHATAFSNFYKIGGAHKGDALIGQACRSRAGHQKLQLAGCPAGFFDELTAGGRLQGIAGIGIGHQPGRHFNGARAQRHPVLLDKQHLVIRGGGDDDHRHAFATVAALARFPAATPDQSQPLALMEDFTWFTHVLMLPCPLSFVGVDLAAIARHHVRPPVSAFFMSRVTADQFLAKLRNIAPEDSAALLRLVIDYMRPALSDDAASAFRAKLSALAGILGAEPALHQRLSQGFNDWLGRQNLLLTLSHVGLLPRNGFLGEMQRRVYDTLIPPARDVRDLSDTLRWVFHRAGDADWIAEVEDDDWFVLLSLLGGRRELHASVPKEWQRQALDVLEKLSVWVAAEEMEGELVRLDPKILERQSPFSALQREMMRYVAHYQQWLAGERAEYHDDAHLRVLLEQSHDALLYYRKRSLSLGASVRLTYLLERLEQTLQRIQMLLDLVDQNPEQSLDKRAVALALFRQLAIAAVQRNSIRALWKQNIGLLARKVSNNASEHGEHYVTDDRRGYFSMLGSAAGAGLIIPLMAILKIQIEAAGFPPLMNALLVGMNYGLGFVLIHMLGFTVATKQPAMTAAHIANTMERDSKSRAKPAALIELVAQVVRTQFVAIVGNVTVALSVAFAIALGWHYFTGEALISSAKGAYLLESLHPLAGGALFYAAIAGVWLFCSGLIAGYFDNRFDLLAMRERIIHHPVLRWLMPSHWREKMGDYLADHYGALWGNFLFGMLLGMSAFAGLLTGLPIDIRHVAFSAANLGLVGGLDWADFLVYLSFALMIGGVNLLVSFALALMVGLRARGLRVPDPLGILRALLGKLMVAPWEFFLPPSKGQAQSQQGAERKTSADKSAH